MGDNWSWSDHNVYLVTGLEIALTGVVAYYIYTRWMVCGKQNKANTNKKIAVHVFNKTKELTDKFVVYLKSFNNNNIPEYEKVCISKINTNLTHARSKANEAVTNASKISKWSLDTTARPACEKCIKARIETLKSSIAALSQIPESLSVLQQQLQQQLLACLPQINSSLSSIDATNLTNSEINSDDVRYEDAQLSLESAHNILIELQIPNINVNIAADVQSISDENLSGFNAYN